MVSVQTPPVCSRYDVKKPFTPFVIPLAHVIELWLDGDGGGC